MEQADADVISHTKAICWFVNKHLREFARSRIIRLRWIKRMTEQEATNFFYKEMVDKGVYDAISEMLEGQRTKIAEQHGLSEEFVESLLITPKDAILTNFREAWSKTGPRPTWFKGEKDAAVKTGSGENQKSQG